MEVHRSRTLETYPPLAGDKLTKWNTESSLITRFAQAAVLSGEDATESNFSKSTFRQLLRYGKKNWKIIINNVGDYLIVNSVLSQVTLYLKISSQV